MKIGRCREIDCFDLTIINHKIVKLKQSIYLQTTYDISLQTTYFPQNDLFPSKRPISLQNVITLLGFKLISRIYIYFLFVGMYTLFF